MYYLGGGHVIDRYIGGDCSEKGAACRDASPSSHVHPNAPPFFIGHGTGDTTVPYAEAKDFVDEMHRSSDSVTLYTAENGPHSYWAKKEYYAANLAAVEAFLRSVLHPAAAAQ